MWLRLVIAGVLACAAAVPSARGDGQTPPLIPEDTRRLQGEPSIRVDMKADGVVRRALSAAEARKDRLQIDFVDGRYVWTSRRSEPLVLTSAGDFIYLSSAVEPGHYVRVRRVNNRLRYIEHVDMEFGSVTYWGELQIVLGKK